MNGKEIRILAGIIPLVIVVVILLEIVYYGNMICSISFDKQKEQLLKEEWFEEYRCLKLGEKNEKAGKRNSFGDEKYVFTQNNIESITLHMLWNQFGNGEDKNIPSYIKAALKKTTLYGELLERYTCILSDIQYFPVAYDIVNRIRTPFEDTWGGAREYGGKRKHEGTDIFAENNVRSYFPVISMTDGRVEQKGWLKMGGYRVGIRSKSGAYFYYAHLSEYADIEEGDYIHAGDVLGYMGDTGYSEIEGTTGNFPVHLHIGIYYPEQGEDISVNPYWILKQKKIKKISFEKDKIKS